MLILSSTFAQLVMPRKTPPLSLPLIVSRMEFNPDEPMTPPLIVAREEFSPPPTGGLTNVSGANRSPSPQLSPPIRPLVSIPEATDLVNNNCSGDSVSSTSSPTSSQPLSPNPASEGGGSALEGDEDNNGLFEKPEGEVGRRGRGSYNLREKLNWDIADWKRLKV